MIKRAQLLFFPYRTERCVLCDGDTGILRSLGTADPERYRFGFYSSPNGGQVCARCCREHGLAREGEAGR